jgi:2-oxoacid:acceptor oxidoreductase gamma subunit (pyruvate/2-ketoisovalerate family)
MFQVRFHGRGGQGVVTAAELLASAAFGEDRHAQAFPSFGSERMGAPVMLFCRIGDKPIRTHEPVIEPDALIIQDPTLLHQVDLFAGLGRDGYMRTREKMPAHDIEVTEALEEGATMRWLSTVAQAEAGRLVIEKMKLDATGFPQPTGEFEELEADCLVLALGQNAELSVLDGVPGVTFSNGVVEVGIFAGGDMVPSERTVTVAIGHGKKAARSIDAFLQGTGSRAAGKHAPASFGALNTCNTRTPRPPSGPGWRRPGGSPLSTR